MQVKSSGSMEKSEGRTTRLAKYLNPAGVVIASLFLLVNLSILASGGIRFGDDSPRYLEGADNLLRGLPLQGKQISYAGYVSLIAFCRFTGTGLPGVVLIQLFFAAIAAVALYDLGRRLHGRACGLIAATLFVVNPDIARWHSFILTDSLYISLVVLSVWCVHTATRSGRRWYVVAAAASLVLAALVRPNGLFLSAAAVLYLVSRAISRRSLRWVAISGIILALVLGAITASRFYPASSNEHPEVTLRNGITGIPQWRVSMPADAEPVRGRWSGALGYAASHPLASLRLGITRVFIELIHVRPFYSSRHNIGLLLTLPLFYLLALAGLKLNRDPSLARLIVLIVIAHLFVVAITFADWDGRYLLYILPLICLLSSCAAASLIDLYLSRRETNAKRVAKAVAGQCASE
jgi:4-amino-4-deoxy-L-arabinose transferase-like glycosyltransferase